MQIRTERDQQARAALTTRRLRGCAERTLTVPTVDGQLEAVTSVSGKVGGVAVLAVRDAEAREAGRARDAAGALSSAGFASVRVGLLRAEEVGVGARAADVERQASRLCAIIGAAEVELGADDLPIGLIGVGAAVAATLVAAARLGRQVTAVVTIGGRPDLAERWTPRITAPTLLLVGGRDPSLHDRIRRLQWGMHETTIRVVPYAGNRFDEPGTAEAADHLAAAWLARHISGVRQLVG